MIFRSKWAIFALDDIAWIELCNKKHENDTGAYVIFKHSQYDQEIAKWENVIHIDEDEIEPLTQAWAEYKERRRRA